MKSLSIIISKPPFGTIHAAEALRMANGAISYGHSVSILLIGDGVYAARKGQRAEETGWTSLSPILGKSATSGRARVFAGRKSAADRGLGEDDLIQGVQLVGEDEALSIAVRSEAVAVF